MKAAIAAVLVPWALAGCTEVQGGISGTQSLRIELIEPASPGSPTERLSDDLRTVKINITALGPGGEIDTGFNNNVQVYAQFLGTLTPGFGAPPLLDAQMTAGVVTAQTVTLPKVFGPTTLWIDDGASDAPTYATGTSPTLWYREPFIADLQTPRSETALDALTNSPLQDKQIVVSSSRYGASGKLLVTSVFAQGYTVSDADCATTPCTTQKYDHAMVFSFSAPRDQLGRLLEEGQVISGFGGGLAEFNGLTEIGFPQTAAPEQLDKDPARLPVPVQLAASWFDGLSNPEGQINFERNEAAPIAVIDGAVCNLDDEFETFKQWKVDPAGVGGDCSRNGRVINVISTGISQVDPEALVGKKLSRLVGVLRPVNLGSFNVWIIFPRSAADVQVAPAQTTPSRSLAGTVGSPP